MLRGDEYGSKIWAKLISSLVFGTGEGLCFLLTHVLYSEKQWVAWQLMDSYWSCADTPGGEIGGRQRVESAGPSVVHRSAHQNPESLRQIE